MRRRTHAPVIPTPAQGVAPDFAAAEVVNEFTPAYLFAPREVATPAKALSIKRVSNDRKGTKYTLTVRVRDGEVTPRFCP